MNVRRHLPDGYWTSERIVAAIQRYEQRYGFAPGATAFNVSAARRMGRNDLVERFYQDGDYPHYGTVVRKFGRWNKAIQAAGFDPVTTGGRRV